MDRPMDPAAPGPPRTTSTPLQTPGGTTHPAATQHMDRHACDVTLDPLPGASRGTGTPANPPYLPPGCPHGLPRARSPGHGPLPPGYAGPSSSGVTLHHTQAPATRPSFSGPLTLGPASLDRASTQPTPFTMATITPCSYRTPRSPWTNLTGEDHG